MRKDAHYHLNFACGNARCELCKPQVPISKRRWPTEPLFEAAAAQGYLPGKHLHLTQSDKFLNDIGADNAAVRIGLHPSLIWTDWFEPAITNSSLHQHQDAA